MGVYGTKHILVVDDEPAVRNYLKMALEDAGFSVATASDGFEALEQVKREPPDLISLDLVMPKRSGVKFHHDLQKNRKWSKIPVLIVTGHARDDLGRADFDELIVSGPGVYLEKPVKPRSYLAAVRKMLGMEAELEEQADPGPLRDEISEAMADADPETLKQALALLKKK